MNVDIAQRLAARRKQAGLSQETLAEQLGVSRQAVSKWERSESSPDTDNLIALAQLYGVSLDDLLYVDDEIKDDVTFEAADRASERTGSTASAASAAPPPPPNAGVYETASFGTASAGAGDTSRCEEKSKPKVQIGFGGIHVLDGDDYVHVSWRDGVHVRDGKKGEEVHVGWNGIHVKEASDTVEDFAAQSTAHTERTDEGSTTNTTGGTTAASASAGKDAADTTGDWRAAGEAWASADDVREGEHRAARAWYGVDDKVNSGARKADGVWSGVIDGSAGGQDAEDNAFVVDGDGVVINGERFDDWRDARDRYGYGHIHDDRWYNPCGYTVKGERFDTLDDAKAKYGPEVGKSIPVRKHYLREFEKSWVKFPYPLVVIIVYLLLGILNGAWAMGLFLFLTIPVYYMVGHAVGRRRIVPLISGTYPIAVVAWFCYMAFVLNQPHPAWVAFLTIPLVEWLVHSLSRWWRDRKRAKAASKAAPIDVEAK